MPFLKPVVLQTKEKREINPAENLKKQLKKDPSRKKIFHYQTVETTNEIYLYNGDAKLIRTYLKDLINDPDNIKLMREIRSDALSEFLSYEGNQKGIGGFTFN